MKKLIPIIMAGIVLAGCSTLPRNVKNAWADSKDWSKLFNTEYHLKSLEYTTKDGKEHVITGYDKDGDGFEDLKCDFIIREYKEGYGTTYLERFAEDTNNDHEFTEDEWKKYRKILLNK